MNSSDAGQGRSRVREWTIQAVLGTAVIALVILVLRSGDKVSDADDTPLYTVARGPLTITVSEAGRLVSKDEIILKNETDRSLKILTLAEEGSIAKEGDVLIELDSDNLETVLDNAALNVKRIESDLTAARENQEIQKNQNQANIEAAELTLKFAILDLERFHKGVHPQNLEQADANIALARENVERAEKDYTWSEKLHAKGFISERELKADELAAMQARLTLSIEENKRDVLVTYTHPQEIESFESQVKQAEMALERAKRKASAELTKSHAGLYHYEAELKEANKHLQRSQERFDACTVVAPAGGMVIYGTSGGMRKEGRELMEVGATVHPKHWLIRMPQSKQMLAEISIREASKPKLVENMATTVTVDALPGETFRGQLTKIAILPDSTQAWLNPDLKVYKCEVELDGEHDTMRPGMNCHVDIVVEEHPDALFVPMQCVVRVGGQSTVYVKIGTSTDRRPVETGLDNNVMIHILDGLSEGDQVLLNPPLNEAGKASTVPGNMPAAGDPKAPPVGE